MKPSEKLSPTAWSRRNRGAGDAFPLSSHLWHSHVDALIEDASWNRSWRSHTYQDFLSSYLCSATHAILCEDCITAKAPCHPSHSGPYHCSGFSPPHPHHSEPSLFRPGGGSSYFLLDWRLLAWFLVETGCLSLQPPTPSRQHWVPPAGLTHLGRLRPSDPSSPTPPSPSSSLLVDSSSLPPSNQISPCDLAPSLLL